MRRESVTVTVMWAELGLDYHYDLPEKVLGPGERVELEAAIQRANTPLAKPSWLGVRWVWLGPLGTIRLPRRMRREHEAYITARFEPVES